MNHYLLTVYLEPGAEPPPEAVEPLVRDLAALGEEMRAAGVWVFGGGLADPGATTVVNHRDEELVTTDGPYLESKEYIGGFDVIEAPDLAAAQAWAGKLARIFQAPIEVRQVENPE